MTSIEKWKFGSWKELESDPGLFTLLVEEFGCQGVEVEEVYDLDALDYHSGDVFGLIFLFKWGNDNSSQASRSNSRRRGTGQKLPEVESTNGSAVNFDTKITNELFFAHQLIPNSCASHALLSVLLNCSEKVKLGDFLVDLKSKLCNIDDPEIRGYALGNLPELAMKHNRFACHEPPCVSDLSGSSTTSTLATGETFHYCCYVPHHGKLYELDGLKAWPINHGETGSHWLEKAKSVISGRIARARDKEQGCHDIRYNLMSVVPSKKILISHKLGKLKKLLQESLQTLNEIECSDGFTQKEHIVQLQTELSETITNSPLALSSVPKKKVKKEIETNGTKKSLKDILSNISVSGMKCQESSNVAGYFEFLRRKKQEYHSLRINFLDEEKKHLRYERDAERRSHDYGKFFQKFLEILQHNGSLQTVIELQQTIPQKQTTSRPRKKSKKAEN